MTALTVFISSVRRGLEEERDALPGLVSAIGHEASRFEDFTAQPVPSRQACLQGVDAADIYLLLLGRNYGQPLADSGVAPTEEELTRARQRGIPVLVFKKTDVDLEPRQAEFVERVERYDTGWFRNSYSSTADLLTKVAAKLREVSAQSPGLTWTPLKASPEVEWVANESSLRTTAPALVEVHVLPVGVSAHSATVLSGLSERLATVGRQAGLFTHDQALETGNDHQQAWAAARSSYGQSESGVRVTRSQALSLWKPLPHDSLGTIIDPQDLAARIASLIHVAADVIPSETGQAVALAVSLSHVGMASEGDASRAGHRRSAEMGMGMGRPESELVRVPPTATVPAAALATAGEEVAAELVAELMPRFRASRR